MTDPTGHLGPRGSRYISSNLTPDTMSKYQNILKDAGEKVTGVKADDYAVPDVNGMMCLKLFMSIEVDSS